MALVQGCGLAPQLTVLRCCLHHTFRSLTLGRPTDDLGIHGQAQYYAIRRFAVLQRRNNWER
ncbi:hypothetical protein PISMIDRAFT_679426, partial [Pisolithus microcarpus 441]